jgi:AhpD family alkylhydroperoxidase
MDKTTKEIAAIAASVAGHCQPCLCHHLAKARELEVSEEDINDVIRHAKVISENGDMRMQEFAEGLMNERKASHASNDQIPKSL